MQLPPLKIDYLKSFTDDTGIFQHAKFCIPRRSEGYTTDDNARALIACVRYYSLKNDPQIKSLAKRLSGISQPYAKTRWQFP